LDARWSFDPLLVWGLFQRGLGLVLLISFTSLSTQVVVAVGSKSALPLSRRIAQLKYAFPTPLRVLYFPTIFWIGTWDWLLLAVPIVGMLSAACVVYGGPYSVYALGVCYACYVSLDLPMALIYPWDALLFESVFLGLLLPATRALPDLAAAEAPAPAVAWAFRWLFFRVMFGFGKQKFLGSRTKDLAYLTGFFLNQPLLSPIGWYAQKLPMVILKAAVFYMFFVEIPAPFFVFWPGPLSVVAAVSTIVLMVGIQLTGSFGYFSLLTMVAAIPLFDQTTPAAFHFAGLFAPGAPWLLNAIVLVHTTASFIPFLFNSWLAQSWQLWAFWYQLPRWVGVPLALYRFMYPFRWLHPYGVFPANTGPGVKITLLLEVTWDDETWHEARFRFAPSAPASAPQFAAPHHPRGDQALIYDTFGLNHASLITSVLGSWDPSPFASRLPGVMFCQGILRGYGRSILKGKAFDEHPEPPIGARISTIMLEAVSLKERRETGNWWKRTYIGPHIAPQKLDPHFDEDVMGEPELWHYDAIFWRRRSRLRPLMERALAGKGDPMQLALLDAPELSPRDVERFWNDLTPLLGGPARTSFDTLPDTVAEVDRRFDRKERHRMHRLLGRFSLILVSRLEPLYLHHGLTPEIPVPTYFQLWMLVQYVIGNGREAYLSVFAEPRSIARYAPEMTAESGLYAQSVFRLEEMTFEAQKLRLLAAYLYPHNQAAKDAMDRRMRATNLEGLTAFERRFTILSRAVSGFFNTLPYIRAAFKGPRFDHGFPELYPIFTELDSGAVVVGEYRYPAPDTVFAKDVKSVRRS
jgi:hypothetical protein